MVCDFGSLAPPRRRNADIGSTGGRRRLARAIRLFSWRAGVCPLLVASPYLVTDFLGDHSIADMEIVQQSHLHLGADGERAILEAITRDAKRRPHVVEDAVGRCEALDRVKGDPLG